MSDFKENLVELVKAGYTWTDFHRKSETEKEEMVKVAKEVGEEIESSNMNLPPSTVEFFRELGYNCPVHKNKSEVNHEELYIETDMNINEKIMACVILTDYKTWPPSTLGNNYQRGAGECKYNSEDDFKRLVEKYKELIN